ncbi:MAG: Kelch repeat-containing protein [Chloroflexota bacterium]
MLSGFDGAGGRQAWAQTGNPAQLPTPRQDHAAALGPDGKIYVAGGVTGSDASPQLLSTVDAYDPVTNTWTPRAPMLTARGGLRLVTAPNGKLYAIGGRISQFGSFGGQGVATVEEYDPIANSWTPRANMPTARSLFGAAVASNGRIYVIGGQINLGSPSSTSTGFTNAVDEYDPISNTWRSRASMPIRRAGHDAVSVGGLILVMGLTASESESGPTVSRTNIDVYDPASDSWSTRADNPDIRLFGGATVTPDGKVYALGGFPFGQWDTAPGHNAYHLQTDTWNPRARMPTMAQELTVVATNDGRVFAIGGNTSGRIVDPISLVQVYIPESNGWLPDLGTPEIQNLVIQSGAAVINHANVTLTIQASDGGSGVAGMSFSNDGTTWSAWEPYATTKPWALAAGPDNVRTVHARVQDQVGNVSAVVTDTILYDTVAPTLSTLTINSGALTTTSTTVSLSLQSSDPSGGSGVSQMAFSNDAGASWSAWEAFQATKSWTLSAGDGQKTVQARVLDGAGNVSGTVSASIVLDSSLGSDYGISINVAAIFTNTVDVTLSIIAPPGTTQMQVSNDGGFSGSNWEPFTTRKAWQITQYGAAVVPRTVYVRFKNTAGTVSSVYRDDIILDMSAPTGSVAVPGTGAASERGAASPSRTIQLTAVDDVSSPSRMQVRLSNRSDFAGALWRPYTDRVTWDFTGGLTIYAQFKDEAGNVSQTYSQSLPGLPPSGSSPNPNCSPRPRIAINTEPAIGVPEGGGALNVTVSTTGSNNGLRAVRFDSFVNAKVHVGSQQNQTAPFAVSIPAGQEPTSLQFVVQRLTNGQPTTVRMSVIDGCGEWSTLVGGGPRAF